MQALQYIGKPLTQEQKNHLRRSLDKDGCVTYGDFVQLVQDMFAFRLPIAATTTIGTVRKADNDIPQIPKIPSKICSYLASSPGQNFSRT